MGEKNTEGKPVRRKTQLESLEEYPNESRAQAAADAFQETINIPPRQQLEEITVETLFNIIERHEMPDVFSKEASKHRDFGLTMILPVLRFEDQWHVEELRLKIRINCA
jgi:2-methylcitrate dehydratase PrpD